MLENTLYKHSYIFYYNLLKKNIFALFLVYVYYSVTKKNVNLAINPCPILYQMKTMKKALKSLKRWKPHVSVLTSLLVIVYSKKKHFD